MASGQSLLPTSCCSWCGHDDDQVEGFWRGTELLIGAMQKNPIERIWCHLVAPPHQSELSLPSPPSRSLFSHLFIILCHPPFQSARHLPLVLFCREHTQSQSSLTDIYFGTYSISRGRRLVIGLDGIEQALRLAFPFRFHPHQISLSTPP